MVNFTLGEGEEIRLKKIPKLEVPSQALASEELIEVSVKLSKPEASQVADLRKVVGEFQYLFINRSDHTTLVTHDRELKSDVPVRSRPYRASPRQEETLRDEIQAMLDLGVIEP